MSTLSMGFIGGLGHVDRSTAVMLVENAILTAITEHRDTTRVEIVFDEYLTDGCIVEIASAIAKASSSETTAFACREELGNEDTPVGEGTAILDNVRILVRFGGGKQAIDLAKTFQEWGLKAYEYDLGSEP